MIDIDGDKGKNEFGFDRFDFVITDKGVIPEGFASAEDQSVMGCGETLISDYLTCQGFSFDEAVSNKYDIYDVTWWVVNMGNLDYLKCGDELNWTTKTSCK